MVVIYTYTKLASLGRKLHFAFACQSIRGILIGKSACEKTTLLLNFLLRPGWLDYDNMCVFGKSLFQPEYRILKKAFEKQLLKESILRLFDNQNEIRQLNLSPVIFLEEMAQNQRV